MTSDIIDRPKRVRRRDGDVLSRVVVARFSPTELHHIDSATKKRGISRTTLIRESVAAYLGWDK